MRFCIISHTAHKKKDRRLFAYAPYIQEMNLWIKKANSVVVVAPMSENKTSPIDKDYQHRNIELQKIKSISSTSLMNSIKALFVIPSIVFSIYKAMKWADHIHVRCPGNIGLLGCFVQIFFPNKKKTFKYAGNWDPRSKQPWSYKLQKWIVSSTVLTKNANVLVYGHWPDQSANIEPFFTASYYKKEIIVADKKRSMKPLKLMFVGSLVQGKNPLKALQLFHLLIKSGIKAELSIFGEGLERSKLSNYITENTLDSMVFLKGNTDREAVKQAYQEHHFLVLYSKSEGWPKVLAEAMFWGCIPLSTPVSCIAEMLDYGKRGLISDGIINNDLQKIVSLMKDEAKFEEMSNRAMKWSQQYTLDRFEEEIHVFLSNGMPPDKYKNPPKT